ncbi:MAG: hypothetical protein JXA11_10345 [Phycisphaerae bacterium]|nr:hypothetical protein [Phycisphaerae bacterium]
MDQQNYWPAYTAETYPWTRWWWLGSAVDKPTITRLLETYRQAGLGGVEITSIYGVKGQERRAIEYLSETWQEMVRHAILEAHRLGMKVDLPPGCGWRIGGQFITDDIAAAEFQVEPSDSPSGYSFASKPSGEMVKRPGPGGEGKTFNPFNRASLQAVIDHFTSAFSNLGIRAQFHDSWEYDSSACREVPETFRELRGYDLQEHLGALLGEGDPDYCARVRHDVQLTLSEMALENFILPWSRWCHDLGQLSRNQAHGTPGNWLDFYAAADIPETESFMNVTFDTPLMSKFASSAAHVTGKTLVSSETGTWLKEHFHVTLGDLKSLIDLLFVAGINHHVYHGTAYSPDDAEWPGWVFYASSQLNPRNTLWRDFGKLNEYVARCQSILQAGQPSNDLLVYFPIHDILHDPTRNVAQKQDIRGDWLTPIAAMNTYRQLWRRGYGFDYISDRQIAELKAAGDGVASGGVTFKGIVVPPCKFLPVETLEHLMNLARQGARVLFVSPAPADVPGWARLEERRSRFAALKNQMQCRDDLEAALGELGVRRERLVDIPELLYIRRSHETGHYYFIVNRGSKAVDAWIPPAVACESVTVMDPMSGNVGAAQTRRTDVLEARIQLQPGESVILRTSRETSDGLESRRYIDPAGSARPLRGEWRVEFLEGGPELPPSYETHAPRSWTKENDASERFAGTAVYRISFNAPSEHRDWLLDLGDVHAAARVRFNGTDIDTLIGPTFQTILRDMRPEGNELEIEVTNLAANRIRDLDRRGVEWKIFEDINFVNREYEPFNAADWPVEPSGLLGPVQLTPLS